MEYFIGIDPSINSTGICIQKFDGLQKISENFIILTGERKLTKREQTANDSLLEFEYWFYKKEDLSIYKENNHWQEYWKSFNMISLTNEIKNIVKEFTKDNPEHIYIVMEGISYGSSVRTKSIFDLAGLNYLVREKFVEKDNIIFTIVTPSEIKKFASGNGNCNKDIMINLFKISNPQFSIVPKVDDISDAWFMSNYSKYLYEQE